MRSQLKDPVLREKVWPDYTFGCKRILFSSEFLPALERPNVELETAHDRGDRARGRAHRRRPRARARLPDLGDRLPHQRLHVPDGDHRPRRAARWKRCGENGAHAHLGICVPGVPEHVHPLRPEHEHLGRLDHLLPRTQVGLRAPGAAAARGSRGRRDRGPRRGRGGLRPRAPAPLHGHRLDAVRLLVPRRRTGASSPTGRATCASTADAREVLDTSEFSFAPLPERGGGRSERRVA